MPAIPSRVIGIIELDPASDQEDSWSRLVTGPRSVRSDAGSSDRGSARGPRYSDSLHDGEENASVPRLVWSARLPRLQRELEWLHRSTKVCLRPRLR